MITPEEEVEPQTVRRVTDFPLFGGGRNLIQAKDGDEEPCSCIPRTEVDWETLKVVPVGWSVALQRPPDCFAFAGGATCTIQVNAKDGSSLAEKVLLALPAWAVDSWKARQLCASPLRRICKLWRFSASLFNTVVLEFDAPRLPAAESLDAFVKRGRRLGEGAAAQLCKQLLELSVGLFQEPAALSVRGLLDPESIFVDEGGALVQWVPVTAVLSARGAKAVLEAHAGQLHAPEYRQVPPRGKMQGAMATDAYAISSLVLRAMAGSGGDTDGVDASRSFSGVPGDFFKRTLYADPEWRLCGPSALEHPWLRGAT